MLVDESLANSAFGQQFAVFPPQPASPVTSTRLCSPPKTLIEVLQCCLNLDCDRIRPESRTSGVNATGSYNCRHST